MKLLSRLSLATLGAGLLGIVAASSAHAQTAYAIAGGGASLIRFGVTAPTTATLVGGFTLNGATAYLDSIDFRLNGVLYGFNYLQQQLYTVNTSTGALTAVGNMTGAAGTEKLGMDFNPTIDRLRIVSEATDNLVYNPNNGALVGGPNTNPAVTALNYAATDVNANANPQIIDNAYTNMNPTFATSTTQYGIDAGLSTLVTIANNAGTLNTVGSLNVTINNSADPYVGFDIYTSLAGVNTAYAILDTTAGTAPNLYTINLNTGAATLVGGFGNFTQVYGLAVTPSATAPEPGTLALALVGGCALAGRVAVRRRRKAA